MSRPPLFLRTVRQHGKKDLMTLLSLMPQGGRQTIPKERSAAEAVQAQPGSVARSPPITTNTSKKKQPIPYKQYIEYIVHLNAEQVVRMKKTAKSVSGHPRHVKYLEDNVLQIYE